MGFLDVISGKQSVGSWLTGRSPDEEFIYNNEEGVAAAVEYFNNVVSTDIPNAQQQIYAAVEELNSLPGIDGCFPSSMFDEAFVAVSDMVGQIGTTMQQKGDDIIAYGKAGFGTKFAATLGMVLAKPAEGFLSAFEDIGDGVLSVTGFIAGKFGNTDLQNSIGDFVKKDLSHDVFQYDKWAKYSAITEDSAISGGLKLVGKTAGYLYAGGVFSGAASSLGLGGTRLGTTALKLASSSTWGATAAAGIGGIGTGTSAGLKAGMEYDDAFGNGLKTGATQAAFAFAGGKLGEKLSKMGEVRQAKKALEGADETLNSASKEMNNAFENIIKNNTDDLVTNNMDDLASNFDDVVRDNMDEFLTNNAGKYKSLTESFDDALKNGGDDALNVLKNNSDDFVKNVVSNNSDEALDAALKSRQAYNSAAQEAKNAASNLSNASSKSLSQYQGYSDAMTKAGERTGRAIGDTMKSGATALKDTASASYSIRHGNVDSGMKTQQAAQSQAAFRDNAMNLLKNDNPIAQGLAGLRNAGASLTAGGASQILPNTINSAANLAKQVPAALGAAAPILPSVAVNEMVHQSGQNPTPNIGSPVPTDGSGIDTQGIIDNANPTPIGGTQNPSPDPTPTPGNSGGSGGGGGGGNSGGGGGGGGQKPTPPTTTPQTTAKPTVAKPTTTPQTTTPPTKNNNDNRNNNDNNNDNKNNNNNNNNRNSNNNDNRQRYDSGEQKNNNGSNNSTHSGYEYGSDGVAGGKPADAAASLADLVDDTDKSIDDIIKGSKYSRIPTSSKPIAAQGGSSSVIPIAAGLTAASAAGLGAKAYMDYKRSKEEDEDEEDEDEDYVNAIEKEDDLVVDGWTEDDESSYEPTGEDEFINIDKQGDEEYYSESENPVPIMGTEELEEF